MNDIHERPDATLPHLEIFSKAAELGSFTGAAKALGLTQAAVSQRIHALEQSLGLPLFHRRGGRVLTTDAGRMLYDFAQRILDLHQEAPREVTGREAPVGGVYAVRKELRSSLLHALEVRGMRCDRDMYIVRDLRRVLPSPARLFLAFLESHPVPAPTP